MTQVMPSPQLKQSLLAREHAAILRQFRDEPPSHTTLEGYLAAKALVAALRSIDGDITRSSVLVALRNPRTFDAGDFVLNFGGRSDRASAFSDITMLRKDGTLLQ